MKVKNTILNKAIHSWILLFTGIMGLLMSSCNSDFLETQSLNTIQSNDTIFLTNKSGMVNFEMKVPGAGNASWRILQYPTAFNFEPFEGKMGNNSSVISIVPSPDGDQYGYGYFQFPLVIDVEGIGLVEYPIVYLNFGNPAMYVYPSVDLGESESGSINIENQGGGILLWEIISKPDWMNLSRSQGVMESTGYDVVMFTVDRTGLEPGPHAGYVQIASNALPHPVSVTVNIFVGGAVIPGNPDAQSGEIVDAAWLTARFGMAVLVKNPNEIRIFKSDSPEPEVISLDRIPRCFSVSENGQKLAIGFSNAEVSVYETSSMGAVQTHTVESVPIGIVVSDDGWIYYTAEVGYYKHIFSLDPESGHLSRTEKGDSGWGPLKKVPGRTNLFTTRPGYGPDSFFLADISEGAAKDTINEIWMDLGGCWFSNDGERFFTGYKKVFRVPDYVPGLTWTRDEPPSAGELDLPVQANISAMAFHASTGRIFASVGSKWSSEPSKVFQLDDKSFVIQKTYLINSAAPAGFPQSIMWWNSVQHIFADPDGSHIWMVNRHPAPVYDDPDDWSVIKMEVE
jgi:hypothetical protein